MESEAESAESEVVTAVRIITTPYCQECTKGKGFCISPIWGQRMEKEG